MKSNQPLRALALLDTDDPELRRKILRSLPKRELSSIPITDLIALSNERDSDLRMLAVQGLIQLKNPGTIGALPSLGFAGDAEPGVVRAVRQAIARLDGEEKRAA